MKVDIVTRLKELRSAKSISTNKLSTMSGLSQSYVRKIESGDSKPSIESLELICEVLEISLVDFLDANTASLNQLKAMRIIRNLSDEQLDGFCKLMSEYESED